MAPRVGVHRRPLAERFWPKVAKAGPDECWLWTAATDSNGYGKILDEHTQRLRAAHRVAYELVVGPIPEGLELDHLCRTPLCVNPRHLEPVTGYENIMRGQSVSALNNRKTHCTRGHELTPENVYAYLNPRRGGRLMRQCRECRRLHDRARQPRKRLAA